MRYESYSEDDTYRLAFEIAEKAGKGAVYALNGDLGAGKTIFAKGFAKGLGIDEMVTSPTFTIVNIYESGKLPFYHFDVYRIANPYEMEDCGFFEYIFGEGVCLIEWAENIKKILSKDTVYVNIKKDLFGDENYRLIEINESRNRSWL